MSRLSDHRRFAAATAAALVVLATPLLALLAVVHRGDAVAGLAAGVAIALGNVWLLARGLDRLQRRGAARVGARALTVATFSRFLLVAGVVGLGMSARGLNPIAVAVGWMLLPVAITVAGAVSLWSEAHASRGRLDAAAR